MAIDYNPGYQEIVKVYNLKLLLSITIWPQIKMLISETNLPIWETYTKNNRILFTGNEMSSCLVPFSTTLYVLLKPP